MVRGTARYVRVQLQDKQYLTIAETEIYANTTGGQASLLSGDEEVLVTAIAPPGKRVTPSFFVWIARN